MRKILILSLFIFIISCKKEKADSEGVVIKRNDTVIEKHDVGAKNPINELNYKIEKKIRKIIPETISNIKKAAPKIISIDSEYLEYFDVDINKVLKVDLKTLKEVLTFEPIGGGYLYFYKNTENFRAISNGWEGDIITRISNNDEELVFPNNIILDCTNEKLIFTGVAEGIDVENKTQIYNLNSKTLKTLKIRADEGKFIDETTLLILTRFPERQDGQLVIYNLKDDSYEIILKNFSANNFIKYLKNQKKLYYVTNSLIHRYSIDTGNIEEVIDKIIDLPFIINDTTLTGYYFDKDENDRRLIFVKLIH